MQNYFKLNLLTFIFFTSCFLVNSTANSASRYMPRIELAAKSGNQRTIGRISAVVPFYQDNSGQHLTYGNLITMKKIQDVLQKVT